MPRTAAAVVNDLGHLNLDGTHMPRLYELGQELEQLPDRATAVEPVLKFIERNSEADLGVPGPLVHFLETIPGYDDAVVKSVKRTPTMLTLWMLNRILNVVDNRDRRNELLALVRPIATN